MLNFLNINSIIKVKSELVSDHYDANLMIINPHDYQLDDQIIKVDINRTILRLTPVTDAY
jgi:hypothetical protein